MRPALFRAICSLAVLTALAVTTTAQSTNPRFGNGKPDTVTFATYERMK